MNRSMETEMKKLKELEVFECKLCLPVRLVPRSPPEADEGGNGVEAGVENID